MPSFCLAEHRPYQPVEQVDRLIGKAGSEIETDGGQRRVPALALVACYMLDRHAPSFTNELPHAGLMDRVATCRRDANAAHIFQTFDQAEHRGGPRHFRHLPQPGQLGLTTTVTAVREGVETATLFCGQAVGQPTLRFATGLVAKFGTKPLQCDGRRHNDLPQPAHSHHRPSQIRQPVILDRLR